MPHERSPWLLPVGLALSAAIILASCVAATFAWRTPTTRGTAAGTASYRTASIAVSDPQAADAERDVRSVTPPARLPTATQKPSAPRVTTTKSAQGEIAASSQPATAPGRRSTLDVPWARPGLCPGRSDSRTQARAAYLASFVPLPAWHTTLFAHPTVPNETSTKVAASVENIHDFAAHQIGLPSEPPPIYLYPNVEVLREHSCAAASAVAYYDGSIHLALTEPASDRELEVSLRHEYAHHVLVSNGVGKPIWFQEGTAMAFANGYEGSYRTWRENPIQLSTMVDSFPEFATPETAAIFNVQAGVMTEFLNRLCLARRDCNPAELVHALLDGSATPETVFVWATAERGGDLLQLEGMTPLQFWNDYEARGNFSPESLEVLLARARPYYGY